VLLTISAFFKVFFATIAGMKNIIEKAFCSSSQEEYVVGKPGTGKTKSVLSFLKEYPFKRFLLLTYNEENRRLNKKRIPGNTEAHTIHSLAYNNFGFLYEDKLTNNISIYDIISNLSYFDEKDFSNQVKISEAAEVLHSLNTFLISPNNEFKGSAKIQKLAKQYFNQMLDFDDKTPITHDGYLKAFYLTSPVLEYDGIIVDEAQDINELMYAIVKQQNTKKIFVGDPDQSIYEYNGSINIFQNKKVLAIQQSYRFGESVAKTANNFLKIFKKDVIEVFPNKKINSKLETINEERDFFTLIARTNAHIFDKCVEFCDKETPFSIIGGVDGIFKDILEGYFLFSGEKSKIKNKILKKMKTFEDLKSFVETTKDPELKYMVKVIEKYEMETPFLIKLIETKATSQNRARAILTTAHKSKGLEFFNVKIANDFFSFFDKNGKIDNAYPVSEVNLYYVAITRAIDILDLNTELKQISDLIT